MKFRYILILLSVLLLGACAEDKGNYVYHEINEVAIAEGLEQGKLYTKVSFVDNLTFDPVINSTLKDFNEADYEYEWKAIPRGADFEDIEKADSLVLSTERRIDMLLTLKPGDYSCFFNVTDKETGVCWSTPFYLRVKSMTSEGWMVLCEENGESRMDIVFNSSEDEDLIAHNIWENESFKPGFPQRLIYNYDVGEVFPMLVTDKDTYVMDPEDLRAGEDNSLKWRFGITPDAVHLVAANLSMFSVNDRWVVVDDKQDVYGIDMSVFGSVFEYPINKIDGKIDFKAAPFVGVSFDDNYSNGGYGCAPAVLYDETHQQFLVIRNNSTYPSVMTFSGEQKFSVQTGCDLVHMESTKPGLIYAILKNPTTQEFFFCGMKLRAHYEEPENWWEQGDYEEYNVQEYYGKVTGTGLDKATMFACHHSLPYLFYSDGQTVYQFDMGHPDTPAKKVLDFPGESIKVLRFNPFVAWEAYEDWERARNYQLVVGTHDLDTAENECGIMRLYDVPNLMGDLVKKKEFKKLGKIVDIVYKERKKIN